MKRLYRLLRDRFLEGPEMTPLLVLLRRLGIPYLIRGRKNTMVVIGSKRMLLGRVPHRKGKAARYDVAYQDDKQERVDLIVFDDPVFKEPWYLLVPPDSEGDSPTDEVVRLYRQRMHIELTFRDWKTHLGVRGLWLEVDIAPCLGRLLLVLTMAYILTYGSSRIGACSGTSAPKLRSPPVKPTARGARSAP